MNRNYITWWRLTKTIFALVLYYVAIVSLVVMTGLIIWKLIISNPSITEPWSVAGLAAAILGVAATVLAILGAVAVAAWWAFLEDRVTDQVNTLYSEQEKKINAEVDALLAETRKNANFIFEHFVSEPEFRHLQNFRKPGNFLVSSSGPVDPFQAELRHLESVGFIERVPGHGFRALREAFQQKPEVNVKDYFFITEAGIAYLEIRTKL